MIVNVLGVKILHVRFISQVWKYICDTFNALLTSHLDSKLSNFY